ncbi:hypothetical protein HK099_005694 [Clydaea vesicula]|uniref:Uncharacterized protein n=1 Tax=Clydaea vesicula TaxID=447962 RepID=A0AAD5U3C4_9FUNG|nr:hypothetical protein HK099_005694 [Clydaea vesicula]
MKILISKRHVTRFYIATVAAILILILFWHSQLQKKVPKEDTSGAILKDQHLAIKEATLEKNWKFALDCSLIYTWANGSIKEHQESYIPFWLNTSHPRVQVVNQSILVDEEDNPTFNTNAIEQNFYKIPGLTKHFIAINDDIFFSRNLEPVDFFTKDGGVNFFFGNVPINQNIVYNHHVLESRKSTAKALIKKFNIRNQIFNTRHAPFVYHKEVFPLMKRLFAEELKNTSSHKFRHKDDLITPLLHHYTTMYAKELDHLHWKYLKDTEMEDFFMMSVTDDLSKVLKKYEEIRKKKPKFFNLNDDFTNSSIAIEMKKFLSEMFNEICFFENGFE